MVNKSTLEKTRGNHLKRAPSVMYVWQRETTFEDVVIESKNVPGNLAVNAQNKLAVTWDRIRRDLTSPYTGRIFIGKRGHNPTN